jgi:hypothetical protein
MNVEVVRGTGMSDFHPKTRLNMNGLPTTLQTPRVMSGSSPAHKTRGDIALFDESHVEGRDQKI